MTIWHRRRRQGTKASWMERRGECAIALTCKWGFVTELKLPDPLYPLPKKTFFLIFFTYSVTNGGLNSGLCVSSSKLKTNDRMQITNFSAGQFVWSIFLKFDFRWIKWAFQILNIHSFFSEEGAWSEWRALVPFLFSRIQNQKRTATV